jgi:hypothetical protein
MDGEWVVYATSSRQHAAVPVTVAHFVEYVSDGNRRGASSGVPLCGRDLRYWPNRTDRRPVWGANVDERRCRKCTRLLAEAS